MFLLYEQFILSSLKEAIYTLLLTEILTVIAESFGTNPHSEGLEFGVSGLLRTWITPVKPLYIISKQVSIYVCPRHGERCDPVLL